MGKDYVEDESGAKFPLNYTFDGVNNFVFSTGVMFEDLQALCLGLVAKLEAAEQSVQPTIATAALEDSPFETGMRRNAVVLSNRNSG